MYWKGLLDMFQKGEYVVYGLHGVCCIIDLEVRTVDKNKIEYYVLEPVDQVGARFYVPTQNKAAASKLSPLMTQTELEELLQQKTLCSDAWIADENQRKQHYRELLSRRDRAALIQMIHTLHQQKALSKSSGRKFHLCDENFLRDAEKLLNMEFSVVLGIPRDEIRSYIQNSLSSTV